MKRAMLCLFVGMLCVSSVMAQSSVSMLGAYQSAKDGDAASGGLGRYQFDFSPETSGLRLFAQAGYLTGFGESELGMDVSVIPVEAGLLYNFKNRSGITPYLGGGVGLYLPQVDLKDKGYSMSEGSASLTHEVSASADTSAFGFLAIAGVEKTFADRFAVFAEMRYASLKVDVKETDTYTLSSPPLGFYWTDTTTYTYNADLSGIGGSVGVSYIW